MWRNKDRDHRDQMMTNSKNIEITAALFFFKRRHESWIKFKEGAVICSRSSSVFFVMEETHPQEYLRLFHNALVSFPFILGSPSETRILGSTRPYNKSTIE